MRNPAEVNYQNMTEEEREEEWKKRWTLPRPYENKHEYEEKIQKHKGINTTSLQIIEGIDNVQSAMEEDRKHWTSSELYRHLYNMRSERGIKRILLGNKDQLDNDPVHRYKESIEYINEFISELRTKE